MLTRSFIIICIIIAITSKGQSQDKVNLLEYEIPLILQLPPNSEIINTEYSLSFKLTERLNVDVQQIMKSEWLTQKGGGHEYNTVKKLMTNDIENKTKENEIDKILEQNDTLFIAKLKGALASFYPYWLVYFVESDESIYRFSTHPNDQEEIDLIKKILESVEYIAPCENPVFMNNENDTIIDLSKFNYPVKFSFSKNDSFNLIKTSWGVDLKPNNLKYWISIDQFGFGTELEESIDEKIEERLNSSYFESLIIRDPQGFIIQNKDFNQQWSYDIYYFHRSDENYYKFNITYRSNQEEGLTMQEEIIEARKLYKRLKGASVAESCQ